MPKPPSPPEPDIHRAARVGDLAALERSVAAGVDVNARADLEVDNGPHLRSLTPLMVAARSIDGAGVETLRWLLAHGADLRATSEGGETAAWYAAGKGGRWGFHEWRLCPDRADRLRFLLDAGLDPNETNFVGRSLLTEASDAGDPSRVALLLDRGVAVQPVLTQEKARKRHKQDLARWHDMMQTAGQSPEQIEAHMAIHAQMSPVAAHPTSYEIPLYCAAQSGSAECVSLLLRAGADPKAPSEDYPSALFIAGSPEVVRILISAGLDINLRSRFEKDALTSIMEGNCCGGNCSPDRFATARVLIEAGADINTLDKYPHSRLAEAAFTHNAEGVEFLLALGAKVVPPPGAPTALHSICWQGEYQDPDTNAACERIIRTLVAAGIPINALDDEGRTPLHEAAGGDWGNDTAVRVLLEVGAEVDAADHEGITPLMLAAEHPREPVIRALLAAAADPARMDAAGRSALDRARGHRMSWIHINQVPPESARLMGEPIEAVRDRHQKALDEAVTVLALLEAASSRS